VSRLAELHRMLDDFRDAGHRRPLAVSLAAIAIRAVVLLVIVGLAGGQSVGAPLTHLRAVWIAVVAIAQLLTYPAYVLAYRSVARVRWPARLSLSTVTRIVVAGFGPLSVSGGFSVDRHALHALDDDESGAQQCVGAMSTIEWAVLAPATCIVAIVLLASGADVSGSLLWPWAVGVPALFVCAVFATRPRSIGKLSQPFGAPIKLLARILDGVASVVGMAQHPRRYGGAWVGTTLYWIAEICTLYAALRAVGLNLGVEMSTLAYATGYLGSRRSLPLGGAGITEALMVYSLDELHQPLGQSVDAVLIYRAFNFALVVIPALIAYRGLLLTDYVPDRRSAQPRRLKSAAEAGRHGRRGR
jgi:uncharacterized membrane protein YbhN (UPF0104 family)